MECPRCGAYNPEGAAFCDLCSLNFAPVAKEAALPAGRTAPVVSRWSARRKAYLGAAIAVVLIAAGVTAWLLASGGGRPNPRPLSIKALFIGNSYTYVNDLPGTVSKIAGSVGDHLDYDMSAVGGYTLQQQAASPDTSAKIGSTFSWPSWS